MNNDVILISYTVIYMSFFNVFKIAMQQLVKKTGLVLIKTVTYGIASSSITNCFFKLYGAYFKPYVLLIASSFLAKLY